MIQIKHFLCLPGAKGSITYDQSNNRTTENISISHPKSLLFNRPAAKKSDIPSPKLLREICWSLAESLHWFPYIVFTLHFD